MTFSVGQKVVCIDDSSAHRRLIANGTVYTIETIQPFWSDLHLAEVPGLGWFAWRFRPEVDRATDISVFTAMLDPLKTVETVKQ